MPTSFAQHSPSSSPQPNISQGYGIGALGYFRRVVESQTEALLNLIEEAAKAENNADAVEGVGRARAARDAEQRLKLAAEALPPTLRPLGKNPLTALYSLFSAGLHGALTEAESLEVAIDLKESLDFIFTKMRRDLEDARAYEQSITKAAELAARLKKREPQRG
jgi:hypothetical protein